ncbi:hypothetical protein GGX14DRAFT_402237 [Mycena pura]|uniref:Uncharacterized protein n=1 Tax=Mycena pura TaxID=153505 RepID=A0AAD6UZ16_9AGAR|nr:hypothetical protein GGX14DRAFT_402237 [Mycena pura]
MTYANTGSAREGRGERSAQPQERGVCTKERVQKSVGCQRSSRRSKPWGKRLAKGIVESNCNGHGSPEEAEGPAPETLIGALSCEAQPSDSFRVPRIFQGTLTLFLSPAPMVRLSDPPQKDIERGRVEVSLAEMNSGTVTVGSRTVADFCAWIRHAEQHLKDAVITDVSWWECKLGLKHQSLLLRFEHTDATRTSAYYLTLERAGRTTFDPRAIDKATICGSCDARDEEFLAQHLLCFALVRKLDSEVIPRHTRVVLPAFYDFLDHKWRGPPATLAHLASYLEIIVARQPNYTLSSSNCFWFSRHIMHALGLLHYSFPFIAYETNSRKFIFPRTVRRSTGSITVEEWAANDPSSIGLFFRFLHYEEWRNGLLLFRRLSVILAVLVACGVGIACAFIVYPRTFTWYEQKVPVVFAILLTVLIVVGALALMRILFRPILLRSVTLLTRWIIRRPTAAVIQEIESRHRSAEAIRGDFIPTPIPLYLRLYYRYRNGRIELAPHVDVVPGQRPPSWFSEWRKVNFAPPKLGRRRGEVFGFTTAVFPSQRELPEPWERDQQIYAPAQGDYHHTLSRLRNRSQDVSWTDRNILQQNLCHELIRMIWLGDDPAGDIWRLGGICHLTGGPEQLVSGGILPLVGLLLASSHIREQIAACKVLAPIILYLEPATRNDMLGKLRETMRDPANDSKLAVEILEVMEQAESKDVRGFPEGLGWIFNPLSSLPLLADGLTVDSSDPTIIAHRPPPPPRPPPRPPSSASVSYLAVPPMG